MRALRLAVLAGVATSLIGLAHRPEVRPAMRVLGKLAGISDSCPLGYDQAASPAALAAARANFALTHQGTEPASSRAVLGLEVGHTTRADIKVWARTSHAECSKTGDRLTCTGFAETNRSLAAGQVLERTLWLEFDDLNVLTRVTTVRRAAKAEVVHEAFTELGSQLRTAQVIADGDPSPSYLSGGSLRQASAEYRFSNYYALIRATNLGGAYLLTEDYRAL